jgi:hypothetical protein
MITNNRRPSHPTSAVASRISAVTAHQSRDQPSRFVRLDDVAQELSVSTAQAYALVRSGDLPAIKVGGRGQ